MEPTLFPRVKICCMASIEEAQMAIRCGASAVGLVSAMPSGAGVIDEELIPIISASVPPGISTFLLTSLVKAEAIIEQARRCCVDTLQMVDRIEHRIYSQLRSALPGVKLVQVVHVTGEESVAEAEMVAPFVDAVLLDSGNPSLPVKELGGTGRVHDWSVSRRIRERIARPVFLAGGLKPENVAQAIEQVRPFAVDVCSGVRTNGRLDETKLEKFFAAVKSVN
jgi:phosphoribosylanthranilate isomerase